MGDLCEIKVRAIENNSQKNIETLISPDDKFIATIDLEGNVRLRTNDTSRQLLFYDQKCEKVDWILDTHTKDTTHIILFKKNEYIIRNIANSTNVFITTNLKEIGISGKYKIISVFYKNEDKVDIAKISNLLNENVPFSETDLEYTTICNDKLSHYLLLERRPYCLGLLDGKMLIFKTTLSKLQLPFVIFGDSFEEYLNTDENEQYVLIKHESGNQRILVDISDIRNPYAIKLGFYPQTISEIDLSPLIETGEFIENKVGLGQLLLLMYIQSYKEWKNKNKAPLRLSYPGLVRVFESLPFSLRKKLVLKQLLSVE